MTTYPDLSPYQYSELETSSASGRTLLNVGWLGSDSPFPKGTIDPTAVAILLRLAVNPENVMRGLHYCEFCDAESPLRIKVPGVGVTALGTGEIHVPANGKLYIAPTLVIHYIEAHGYRPPDEFIEALENMP